MRDAKLEKSSENYSLILKVLPTQFSVASAASAQFKYFANFDSCKLIPKFARNAALTNNPFDASNVLHPILEQYLKAELDTTRTIHTPFQSLKCLYFKEIVSKILEESSCNPPNKCLNTL